MPPETPNETLELCLDELAKEQFGHKFGARIASCLERIAQILCCERIIDWPEVLERTKLSKRTIQRQMELGQFPLRVELSDCRSGWRNSEVERWIRSRPRTLGE
jgi:predicted DNA-binding transcriptional regulator AlpA